VLEIASSSTIKLLNFVIVYSETTLTFLGLTYINLNTIITTGIDAYCTTLLSLNDHSSSDTTGDQCALLASSATGTFMTVWLL